jgi:nucleoside-diphosphate-sugar epimerase
MARRALVTGASGFLGGFLARRLARDGWEVHCLSRNATIGALPGFAVHRVDASFDSVAAAVRASRPDVVFHLAALYRAAHAAADVDAMVDANVRLMAQLLEAMSPCASPRLVNAATAWQHFEDSSYRPVNLYAATKQAAEDILAYYCEARAVAAVSLVLNDTYGPGDPRRRLFALLAEAARSPLPVNFSPGEQRLDLVYVDDVVDAFVMAAERVTQAAAGSRQRFAVRAPDTPTLREVAALYAQVAGRPLNIRWGGRDYRPREVMQPATLVPRLEGWSARVPLREGMRRILAESAE